MGKRKKSQLKPVARGFTTTSLYLAATENEAPSKPSSATEDEAPSGGSEVPGSIPGEAAGGLLEGDEQPLQDLVERLQEKTEKEITR
jgi:ATP-dependent RNA helicase DHX29